MTEQQAIPRATRGCDYEQGRETMNFRSKPARVGLGFTVTFTFDGESLTCEWEPDVPSGEAQDRVLSAYRAARQKFLAEVARKANIRIASVEL